MMTSKKKTTRFVRPLSKGQITIPIEFRRQLGISEETILGVTLREDKIEITPQDSTFVVSKRDTIVKEAFI